MVTMSPDSTALMSNCVHSVSKKKKKKKESFKAALCKNFSKKKTKPIIIKRM